jgi:sugar phosphate isomerase/epimerase
VIVVSGTRNGHTNKHCRRLILDALLELADSAVQRGVKLLLLPMHEYFSTSWTFLNSLDEALDVLNRINHRSVRLAFDTYQMWKEPQLLDRIPEIASMTGIVQISDALQEPQSHAERYNPGDGVIPLGQIIQGFQQAGFDGYYDVQVWSKLGWSGDYPATSMQCRETILRLAEEPRPLNT